MNANTISCPVSTPETPSKGLIRKANKHLWRKGDAVIYKERLGAVMATLLNSPPKYSSNASSNNNNDSGLVLLSMMVVNMVWRFG